MSHLVSGKNYPKNLANLSMMSPCHCHLIFLSLVHHIHYHHFRPCITPSVFHSRFKTYLFHKSFPPYSPSPFWTDLTDFTTISGLNCSSVFLLFCSFHLFSFDSCDSLSWFYQLLNCTTNPCTLLPLVSFITNEQKSKQNNSQSINQSISQSINQSIKT